MTAYRRTILAIVRGRLLHARLASALTVSDEILFFDVIADLRAALLLPRDAITVIMEPRDAAGESTAALFRLLAQRSPAVVTIGYLPRDCASEDIREVAISGADRLIQEGIDDVGIALRAAYHGGIETCAARAVRRAIADIVTGEARTLVDYCLDYPRQDMSIDGLSRALGCDRKTLWNHTARVGLPGPSELVIWSRLLLAAGVLESTGYPVEVVSNELEFASPSAFRNMCRRHAKQKPTDWREKGGLARAVEAFAERCRELKRRPTPKPPA